MSRSALRSWQVACGTALLASLAAATEWGETGIASWYGKSLAGRLTASQENYDPTALTAAHRTLPFGTLILVVNTDNQRRVIVRINDRGPHVSGRVIDVSEAAAQILGLKDNGLANVRLKIVGYQASNKE